MDRQSAERLVKGIFEDGFSRGDFEGLHAYVAADYLDHSPIPAPAPGPEGFEARIRAMRAAFGDFHVDIDDVTVDADRIWFRWAIHGTHVGTFAGREPTGRAVTLEGLNMEVVADGKIVEHFSQFDRMGLIQQLDG
jgi:predicted ester cyclase